MPSSYDRKTDQSCDVCGSGLVEQFNLFSMEPEVVVYDGGNVKVSSSRVYNSTGLACLACLRAAREAEKARRLAEQSPPPVVEEQTEFSVILKSAGDPRVATIKVIRAETGLGLKECKSLVDSLPSVVKGGLSKAEAQELLSKIEGAGGTGEIK